MPKVEKAKSSTSTKASTKVEAKSAETVKVKVNQRLVEAIRASDGLMKEATTALVRIGEICVNEQITRAEAVESFMEAREVTKATAESQYSRMKKLWDNPEILEKLKSGEMNLKMAREATTKKQDAPNKAKQEANLEKRWSTQLAALLATAKEAGYDLNALITAIKASAKKEGIR